MEVDDSILRDIQKQLKNIQEQLARREHVDDTVAKHEKLLYGSNGAPGLKSRVERNDSRLKWMMGGVSAMFMGAVYWVVDKLS